MLHSKLIVYFNENSLLTFRNFGFKKRFSATTLLDVVSDSPLRARDQNMFTKIAFMVLVTFSQCVLVGFINHLVNSFAISYLEVELNLL